MIDSIGSLFVLIATTMAIVGLGYLVACTIGPALETTVLEILRNIQRRR